MKMMLTAAKRNVDLGSILDALQEQIAVIDREGMVRYVNRAWVRFGLENGAPPQTRWHGFGYMSVFDDENARGDVYALQAEQGMRQVMSGTIEEFSCEYPCHSAQEKRWFVMRIAALSPPEHDLLVVSHHDITQQKLAEERLENQSLQDALTGLPNRRHFDLFLSKEWKRCKRSHLSIAIAMIDIDFFKKYNDFHGHLAGDDCLRRVAGLLHAFARRPSDLVARFGGEEFVLVLGNTGLDRALPIAEEIRQKTLGLNLRYGDDKCLSVSLGVVAIVPEKGTAEDLLRLADEALYRAKAGGRNRVEQAESTDKDR